MPSRGCNKDLIISIDLLLLLTDAPGTHAAGGLQPSNQSNAEIFREKGKTHIGGNEEVMIKLHGSALFSSRFDA
jgi:hypothetical protein